jgi:hypothetical protein
MKSVAHAAEIVPVMPAKKMLSRRRRFHRGRLSVFCFITMLYAVVFNTWLSTAALASPTVLCGHHQRLAIA